MLKYHIKTVELATAQAFVQFDSIPQDYSDLVVLMSARSSQSSRSTAITVAFNYDNSSSYSFKKLIGYDSSQVYGGSGSGTPAQVPEIDVTGNSATANTFGNTSFYISNYTSASAKSVSVDQTSENNSSNAYVLGINSYLYSSANPITSIQFGLQGHNYMAGTTISLYGVKRGSDGLTTRSAVLATGGTVSTAGAYTVHTFTGSGTFVPAVNLETEYLVIAGGGGGGHFNTGAGAGGGGAGGYRSSVPGESSGGGASAESRLAVTAGTSYTVTVGAGGAGGQQSNGTQGADSVFGGITSIGGGFGARGNNAGSSTGGTGGSGGGGGAGTGGSFAGARTTGQGFAGGTGGNNSTTYSAGGGGGAGGVGGNTIGENAGGSGGPGLSSSITGSAVFRAGGGGGAILGAGGSGVGGTGSDGSGGQITAGATNTGSGGGGHYGGNTGQSGRPGGSGVVIIRYLTP
jgi:hypothetical protein